MIRAVCRVCGLEAPYTGYPPDPCERCKSPFFWFKRMAQTLWCRYPDCQVGYASVGGEHPLVCPSCEQPGRWTTQEPASPPMPKRSRDPVKPYRLTAGDRQYLRRKLGVDPDR